MSTRTTTVHRITTTVIVCAALGKDRHPCVGIVTRMGPRDTSGEFAEMCGKCGAIRPPAFTTEAHAYLEFTVDESEGDRLVAQKYELQ